MKTPADKLPENFDLEYAKATLNGKVNLLSTTMIWRSTPQGVDFWTNEYNKLIDSKPLSPEAITALKEWITIAEEKEPTENEIALKAITGSRIHWVEDNQSVVEGLSNPLIPDARVGITALSLHCNDDCSFNMSETKCDLCKKYQQNCSKCPLSIAQENCGDNNSTFRRTERASNLADLKRMVKNMVNVLLKLEEEYAAKIENEKNPSEPTEIGIEAIVNGKKYNTSTSAKIAHKVGLKWSTLYKTPNGGFFLVGPESLKDEMSSHFSSICRRKNDSNLTFVAFEDIYARRYLEELGEFDSLTEHFNIKDG